MSHGIYKCSCGAGISRCRCFDHNEVHVIPNGCERCKRSALEQSILIATRRPRQFEVIQYTTETEQIVSDWIEAAGNYLEDHPEHGEWIIKITYPWGTRYEVDVYADKAFRYWFDLPA